MNSRILTDMMSNREQQLNVANSYAITNGRSGDYTVIMVQTTPEAEAERFFNERILSEKIKDFNTKMSKVEKTKRKHVRKPKN